MDLKDGIDKIQQLVLAGEDANLAQAHNLESNGQSRDYLFQTIPGPHGRKLGDVIQPFRAPKLEVSTLTGFVDAIKAGVCGDIKTGKIIHVEDYLNVSVKDTSSDAYGVRNTLLKATHTPIDAFKFDTYYEDPQKFIIALQVAFLQTNELLYLIKIASNLKAGNSVETKDDGFSQTVTVKRGEIGTVDLDVPPRMKLVPLRSFSESYESNPVESEFLLRFKQGQGQQPIIALFAIDGAKWQAQIMQSIKHYLAKHLEGVPILA